MAFIPFWIVNGLLFCIGTCACSIDTIRRCKRQNSQSRHSRKRIFKDNAGIYCLACLFFAPLLIFQILLALKDGGELNETTYGVIFFPFILWLAAGLCFACGLGTAIARG